MITIATFPTPEDAHLFRAFLASRGIEGVLRDEYVTQLFWHYSNVIGGVRFDVDDEDAAEARAIYQEYMSALRDGPYPVEPVRAWPLVLLASLFVGVPLLLFGRKTKNPARRDDG